MILRTPEETFARADGRVLVVNIGSPAWRGILALGTYQRGSKFKDGQAMAVWDDEAGQPLTDAMEMAAPTEAAAKAKAEAMADAVKAYEAAYKPAKKAAAKPAAKGK